MKITHLNASETGLALKRLMRGYKSFHWAVAWATESPISAELLLHTKKIRQLIIGIDFDHTSPALLRKLMPLKAVRVADSQGKGTFHPKVYGFVDGDKVAVLMGSSNFTRGGTHTNEEACLLLEGSGGEAAVQGLLSNVAAWWSAGTAITPEFLDAYERRCAASQEHRKALAKKLFIAKPRARIGDVELLSLTWADYVKEIKAHAGAQLETRLQVLRTAATIFAEAASFADISDVERKAIAGYVGVKEQASIPRIAHLDWGWFGSMKGAGIFKNRVAKGGTGAVDPNLVDAVDCIPPKGPVTEDEFKAFVQRFRKAFEDSERKGRLASATRLLAMKRPDYFVCVDSQNRRELAAKLDYVQSNLTLDSYWDWIVEPLMSARWWSAPRPTGLDRHIWDGRTALLDVMFYTPGNATNGD